MSDVYSFTTTENDSYLQRVVSESCPNTNVLLVHEKSTEPYNEGHNLFFLIKINHFADLAERFPNETLMGYDLGDLAMEFVATFAGEHGPSVFQVLEEIPDYLVAHAHLDAEDVYTAASQVRHELRRLNNLEAGRTVRVEVESL